MQTLVFLYLNDRMRLNFAGDLRQFYLTPVDCTTPYEALSGMQLPENLHVQQEYIRFHPGEISCIYHLSYIIIIVIHSTFQRAITNVFTTVIFSDRHRYSIWWQDRLPEELHCRDRPKVQEEISRTPTGKSVFGRANENLNCIVNKLMSVAAARGESVMRQ